ncbi:hypothetical protein ABPG75_000760 [Micractinium tetrahymenae]
MPNNPTAFARCYCCAICRNLSCPPCLRHCAASICTWPPRVLQPKSKGTLALAVGGRNPYAPAHRTPSVFAAMRLAGGLLCLLQIAVVTAVDCPDPTVAGFTFYKGKDGLGGEDNSFLGMKTPDEMAAACLDTPGCKGFSGGFLIKSLPPPPWLEASPGNACAGLYVRNGVQYDDTCHTFVNKLGGCTACSSAKGCTRCPAGSFLLPVPTGRRSSRRTCCPNQCITCDLYGRCIDFSQASPLLSTSRFPRFDKIRAESVSLAQHLLLFQLDYQYDDVLSSRPENYTWEEGMDPLVRIDDWVNRFYTTVFFLASVVNSPEWEAELARLHVAMEAAQLKILQDPRYQAHLQHFQSLAAAADATGAVQGAGLIGRLTTAQKRVLELRLRDAKLAGGDLNDAQKRTLQALNSEVATAGFAFAQNVLHSSTVWQKLVTEKADVEGLPQTALELAAQQARQRANISTASAGSGPWLITLDQASSYPVLAYAKSRALREAVFRARYSQSTASFMGGKYDNTGNILQILEGRRNASRLLGFPTYAHFSMQTKMATLSTANALEEALRKHFLAAHRRDVAVLAAYAKSKGFNQMLQMWDQEYFLQALKAEKYRFSVEELGPYLSLDTGLKAVFATAERLFGAKFVAADGEHPVWHPDVRFFKVFFSGKIKGYLYIDPYFRPGQKNAGAWTTPLVQQSRLFARPGEAVRPPIVTIAYNFPQPAGGKPSLLSWDDMQAVLFHEMGHALQMLLTTQTEAEVAGVGGIEQDAVEFASQFMENWPLRDPATLKLLTHYRTGQPIPQRLVDGLLASSTFMNSFKGVMQLYLGQSDLAVHAATPPKTARELQALDWAVVERNFALLPPKDSFQRLHAFTHIFAANSGYAAGYYGYMWSKVMAADAFAAFQDAGLGNASAVKALGERFRSTVLGLGGSLPAGEVYRRFRGRDADMAALLRDVIRPWKGLHQPFALAG